MYFLYFMHIDSSHIPQQPSDAPASLENPDAMQVEEPTKPTSLKSR